MDEPENLSLRVLQELRAEMRERFDTLDGQVADLSTRVDGNTLILNLIAGGLHDHEQRVTVLEQRGP